MNTKSSLLRASCGALLIFVGGFAVSGCATRGYQTAARTSASIGSAASELESAQQQLAAATTHLQRLVQEPTEDLRPQFQAYERTVTDLERTAAALDRRAEQIQQQRQAYLQQWQQQNQEIQTDEVRERSLARQQEVAQQFGAFG